MQISLRKSCSNASNFFAPGATAFQKTGTTSSPVSLSVQQTMTRTVSMQDVIDLVGEEYICVSSDEANFSFWWNPQKILSGLEPLKKSLNYDWDNSIACQVAAVPA